MNYSTSITITRDGSEEIELEVTGRYCATDHCDGGIRECDRFEDIEAVVVEDVHHDEHANLLTFKAGEVVSLTPGEEELAEQALLKSWARQ